jgi:hypothetical protein
MELWVTTSCDSTGIFFLFEVPPKVRDDDLTSEHDGQEPAAGANLQLRVQTSDRKAATYCTNRCPKDVIRWRDPTDRKEKPESRKDWR